MSFDQFKGTFIAESFELLEEMEDLLSGLDDQEVDLDKVNAIFRCAHSIKGGAGAFGFDKLVAFTHILEALLDAMRDGNVNASSEVIDALLQSVDIVHHLVTAAQEGREVEDGFGGALAKKLKTISGQSANDEPVEPPVTADNSTQEKSMTMEKYEVTFIPHGSLFESGNEPLLILRELIKSSAVVEVRVDYSAVPAIDKFDWRECYLQWSLDVQTDEGIEIIDEAFEFVEDECDLKIKELGAVAVDIFENDDTAGLFGDDEGFENDDTAGLFDDDRAGVQEFENDDTAGLFDDEIEAPKNASKPAAATQDKKLSASKPKAPVGVSSIRVDLDKVDNLVNMVGELVITQAMILNHTKELPQEEFQSLIQSVEALSHHTRGLQEAVMAVRMQPVKSVFSRMPRIVRDLSSQLNKDIKMEMFGETTEIDKTVIEQLGDPLTHMIRNSADHGIESPDDREASGKPRQGTIKLSADNTGGRISIEISDDGGGINRHRVLSAAIEKGVVAEDAQLSDEEIDHLIFAPGFSTAAEVTAVSGRGVGMDVVKRNITELGGNIEVINMPGQGTRFLVSLPLTLAILDGMIIRVGKEDYIIPVNNILESINCTHDDIQSVSSGADVISVRGEFIPILYLNKIFRIDGKDAVDSNRVLVVLVESGRNKYGLVVDELVGQQQVVIKSIEENADPIAGVSGATILGDGKVSLILDIAGLQQICVNRSEKSTIAA